MFAFFPNVRKCNGFLGLEKGLYNPNRVVFDTDSKVQKQNLTYSRDSISKPHGP